MNLAKQGLEKYQESQSPAPTRTSSSRILLYLRLTALSHRRRTDSNPAQTELATICDVDVTT